MGQKVHPNGIRLGIVKPWNSTWFANTKEFADNLDSDFKVRQYLTKELAKASVSRIVIERPAKSIRVTIHTARPGIVIGKKGEDVEKLRKVVADIAGVPAQINIAEVPGAPDGPRSAPGRGSTSHNSGRCRWPLHLRGKESTDRRRRRWPADPGQSRRPGAPSRRTPASSDPTSTIPMVILRRRRCFWSRLVPGKHGRRFARCLFRSRSGMRRRN
mgnify:CR=1 FL=1